MRQLISSGKQSDLAVTQLTVYSRYLGFVRSNLNSDSTKKTSSARAVRKKIDRKKLQERVQKLQTLEKAEKGKSACFAGIRAHDPANASAARVNVIFPYR